MSETIKQKIAEANRKNKKRNEYLRDMFDPNSLRNFQQVYLNGSVSHLVM